MVFPMFQVLGKSDNSNRFWTPCCVLLRNFLHFLPSFCLHISKTMESDIFSFMWKTDKTVRFARNQQLGSQIILHTNVVYSAKVVLTKGKSKVIHPKYSKHWFYTVAHTIDCVCRKCQIMDYFFHFSSLHPAPYIGLYMC